MCVLALFSIPALETLGHEEDDSDGAESSSYFSKVSGEFFEHGPPQADVEPTGGL